MSHLRDGQVFALRGYLLLRMTERVQFLYNKCDHSQSYTAARCFSLLFSVNVCYRLS